MTETFNELWERAERTLSDDTSLSTTESLATEIISKFKVYSLINKNAFAEEDLLRLKTKAFGRILLTITQLSLKDNVNVYAALKASLDDILLNNLK